MTKFSGPLQVIPGNNTAATNKIQLCKSGTDHTNPTINLAILGAANSAASYVPTLTNASMGQAATITIPDPGASTASFILNKSASAQTILGSIYAGASGTAGTFRSYPATATTGYLALVGVSNSGNTATTISNAAMGQASVISIPDPGSATASFILDKKAAGQTISSGGLIVSTANIQAGSDANAGFFLSYPATTATGYLKFAAVSSAGAFNTTVSNASMGQSTVVSIPDPGAATAKFVLDTGTNATATVTKISTGATPVPLVDPGSCTITAAAGASNVSTVTVQLKDGAGTNIARSVAFRVYASSAADGLTLASAASTGFSVASGGLSLANGTAVTTQISAMSSATGGCVLSLTDTAKQTSYLVLVLDSGNKISAQLATGDYGA